MENPIKMDDLGVPLFLETPICNFKLSSAQPPIWLLICLSFPMQNGHPGYSFAPHQAP